MKNALASLRFARKEKQLGNAAFVKDIDQYHSTRTVKLAFWAMYHRLINLTHLREQAAIQTLRIFGVSQLRLFS